jgi:AcrR family transcriptional regulator
MNNDTERIGIEKIPRGRPRSKRADNAILDAALRLMAEGGYARMSMDRVAAAAGVAKPTIYRRFAGKAALATAALADLRDRRPPPESDDPRSDLVEELSRFRAGVERPYGMAMVGTVLAEEEHVPQLLEHFRRDVVHPRRRRLREILRRAPLRAGLDPDTAASMLVGSYYAEYLSRGAPPRTWAERVADAVLEPSANRKARRAGSGAGSRP